MVEVSVPSSESSVSSRRLAVHALGTLNTAASSHRRLATQRGDSAPPVGECGEMWASSRQCGGGLGQKLGGQPKNWAWPAQKLGRAE